MGLIPDGDERLRRAESRLEAAELELERAHRLLDEVGVPRGFRAPGERDPVDYGLAARLQLLLDDLDDGSEDEA